MGARPTNARRSVRGASGGGAPQNADWKGETGRVNNLVEKYAARWNLRPDDTIIYACGHPGMIEDVKERMTPQDYEVKEERFWKDD